MTKEEIVARTNRIFEEGFEIAPERLVPEARIFDELGLDSLDIVDLIVALQKQFHFQIREDERIRAIRTLGDVHAFVALVQGEEEQKRAGAGQ